ncbi:MAG TPA: hypothetical protein VFN25_05025 [Dokdonella sp.]|uniref:hypothetical protein n=1 Tax=Dokdonella sp. TaxID=2291710 RepID=UPI002D7F0F45|nr:hypothetical protein [Dokdonella sp.]HET9032251.1 hypothetical protein [Dokdonella sp.]
MLGLLASLAAFPAVAAPGNLPPEQQAATSDQPDQPTGLNFKYLRLSGDTFHSLDSRTVYKWTDPGCYYVTSAVGIPRFAHKVELPHGAVVRFMRLYFYDDSISTLRAFFTIYDAQGNSSALVNVGSETTGGFSSTLAPEFHYEVDNQNTAIDVVVNLNPGADTALALRFCGVRIAYDAPIADRIFANGFDSPPL